MNKENALRFGNYIGKFLKLDRALVEDRPQSYLRVQVEVDICKALKVCVFIKNDDGSIRWLAFKYERISYYCFSCGKLGHVVAGCSTPISHVFRPVDPQNAYDPWMKPGSLGMAAMGSDYVFRGNRDADRSLQLPKQEARGVTIALVGRPTHPTNSWASFSRFTPA